MQATNSNPNEISTKGSRFFDTLIAIVRWLQIAASPLLIGLALGAVAYIIDHTQRGLIIGISLAALGLLIGILWANHHWKSKGTEKFMSSLYSTPIKKDGDSK